MRYKSFGLSRLTDGSWKIKTNEELDKLIKNVLRLNLGMHGLDM
jgi:hypothetical protein